VTKYPKQQQMEVKFYLYACKYVKFSIYETHKLSGFVLHEVLMTEVFRNARKELSNAQSEFLAASEDYEREIVDLSKRVNAQADQFLEDPERSVVLHMSAQNVKDEIINFGQIEYGLAPKVALLLIQLNVSVADNAVEQLQNMDRHANTLFQGILEQDGLMPELDSYEKLFTQASVDEIRLAANQIRIATGLYELHLATLKTYLRDHVDRDPVIIIEAIFSLVNERAQDAALQGVWEAAKVLIPEVAGIGSLARIYGLHVKLQEKILKLHQPYRPAGPEDAILDLPIKLAAQNEVTASVIEALAGNTQTD